MKDIELLAPAGGTEALHAAVMSGADAVYIGGKFSARNSAAFTTDEIKKNIEFCHLYGVKVHVAVNTLIKENEIDDIEKYATELSDIGVDAVIIQDLGVADIFKRVAPELPIHASTQMTVTSLSGVKLLSQLGFSRIVLARELSLSEIERICKNSDSEIEVFAHGALCMSYSGQCLMSSIIGGRSGNRGRCAQPCRLPYEIISNDGTVKSGCLLSPKDLSLIDELNSLKKIGVDSIKIEGRLKSPAYVAAVTSVFRRCIDNNGIVGKNDRKELLDAFNRGGFTKGYFRGVYGAAMMSGEKPGNVADGSYTDNVKGILNGNIQRKIPVKIFAGLSIGKPLLVKITDYDGNSSTAYSGCNSERAINRPMSDEALIDRLKKTGGTCFECAEAEVYTDGICTISAKEINAARRQAIDILAQKRMILKKRNTCELEIKPYIAVEKTKKIMLSAEVSTVMQAKTALKMGIERVYVPHEIISQLDDSDDYAIVEKLPVISNERNTASLDCCLVSGMGEWYDNKGKDIYGNYRLNVTNSYSIGVLSSMKSICLSPELNLKEIKEITAKKIIPTEIIGYGRITLMTMKNCPFKAAGVCKRDDKSYRLRDRKRQEFYIKCNKGCVAELLNSKPLYMADKWSDIQDSGADIVRLIFTTESTAKCEKIIGEYIDALNNKSISSLTVNTFTRGHFYRGVL